MNKKLIALAVAGAITGYGAAANAADVSGFAVVDYVLTSDQTEPATGCDRTAAPGHCENTKEGKFGVTSEIDVTATPADGVTVRIDTDLELGDNNTGAGNSATVEQAYFAMDLAPVTVIVGAFNNPIGQEAEDIADWNFGTSSMIRSSLDNQTTLHGNNVAGAAVVGAAGPATITAGFLNHLGGANGENSMALLVNASPIPGLDVELGLVTQESEINGTNAVAGVDVADNVGDVMNFNVQYDVAPVAGLVVGLDYATYDELADTAYNLWGTFAIPGTKLTVGLRLEELSWATPAGDPTPIDSERMSFNIAYKAASNLKVSLEHADAEGIACPQNTVGNCAGTEYTNFAGATGAQEGALTKLKFTATF